MSQTKTIDDFAAKADTKGDMVPAPAMAPG